MLLPLLFPLAVSAAAIAMPTSSSLLWSPCPSISPPGGPVLQCSILLVPRDYTNASAGSLALDLLKWPATSPRHKRKKSILYNPGGPGSGGRTGLADVGASLAVMLSGEYDIVSWDPRGTVDTLTFSCFESQAERVAARLAAPIASDASSTALEDVWAARGVLAEECRLRAAAEGELVGTAYTARDMMAIVDALDEDGLLRYWGHSYGTVLGMTAAAMFPDRMDRVVLDGVENPHDYYQGGDTTSLQQTDAVLDGFFAACMAAPSLCPLASLGTQGVSLAQQVTQLLDGLRNSSTSSHAIDFYGLVKGDIFGALYNPTASWPALAMLLAAVLPDPAAVTPFVEQRVGPNTTVFDTTEAEYGIQCGDTSFRVADLPDIVPVVDGLSAQSSFAGDLWSVTALTCARWPFVAKERVTPAEWGNVTTRHPVLFVGNVFDPVTPLASARNASAGFADSVVLVQNGYGHTSIAQPSRCTARHIRSYFAHGTLPPPDTVCQVDLPPFANQTFVGAFGAEANGNGTRADKMRARAAGDHRSLSQMWSRTERFRHHH